MRFDRWCVGFLSRGGNCDFICFLFYLFTIVIFLDCGCSWDSDGCRDDDKDSSGNAGGGCSDGCSGGSFGRYGGCRDCDGDFYCATGTWEDKGIIIAWDSIDGLDSALSSTDYVDGSTSDTLADIENLLWDDLIVWDTSTTWLEGEEGIAGDIVSSDAYYK